MKLCVMSLAPGSNGHIIWLYSQKASCWSWWWATVWSLSLSYIMTSTLCTFHIYIYIKKRLDASISRLTSSMAEPRRLLLAKSLSICRKRDWFIYYQRALLGRPFLLLLSCILSLSLENESQVPRNPIYTRPSTRREKVPTAMDDYIDWCTGNQSK